MTKKGTHVSDVGPSSAPKTVMLRERVWHIDIKLSRSKVSRFISRNKGWISLGLIVLAALISFRYFLIGFASTADFYPSSCLGNWQNVENALGTPSLPDGSPAQSFNSSNAAFLPNDTAQMYCGNFSGSTDIELLKDKAFQKASLVLSWTFNFPEPENASSDATSSMLLGVNTSTTISAGGGGGGGISTNETAPTIDTGTNATDTSNNGVSTTTDIASTSVPAPTSTANTITTSTTDTTTDTTATTTGTTAVTTTPTTANATSTADASQSAPTPTSTPTPPPAAPASTPGDTQSSSSTDQSSPPADTTPPPSTPPPTDPSASPSSYLWQPFVPFAYAQNIETSSASSDLSSVSTSSLSMVDATVTPPSVPTTTLSINTAAFQNLTTPSSSAGDILSIEISTDGVTWVPVTNINASNWENGQYDLPIRSWDELEHLQVALVALPTATVLPQVYVDAMGVRVEYGDGATNDVLINPATSTALDANSPGATSAYATSSGAPLPPPSVPLTSVSPSPLSAKASLDKVFSPVAEQSCSVKPFSGEVQSGKSTSFLLTLVPPSGATSLPPLFDVALGALPDGITARIIPGANGVDTIGIDASASTVSGSYTVVVVYKERQKDGTILPNFCQFNLLSD